MCSENNKLFGSLGGCDERRNILRIAITIQLRRIFFFGGFVSHIDKKYREKITQFVLFGSRSIINVKACAELLRLVRNIKIRHRRHSAHESNFLTAQMESATSRISRRSRPRLGMEDS